MPEIIKSDWRGITAPSLAQNTSLDLMYIPEEQVIFYDVMSKRYFTTTYSQVLQAEYHLNRNFVLGGAISIGQWYEFLGLTAKEEDYFVGWTSYDGYYWIDFDHYAGHTHDGLLYFGIDPMFSPRDLREDYE